MLPSQYLIIQNTVDCGSSPRHKKTPPRTGFSSADALAEQRLIEQLGD